ncbi:UNVERIFIED_CONTAM: hypothetical protein RMT77_018640 [Armadillidium vulgare]
MSLKVMLFSVLVVSALSAPQNGYGAPRAPQNGYGAPAAPRASQNGYGAPAAPRASQNGYGAPAAPRASQNGYSAPQNGYGADSQEEPARYNFDWSVQDDESYNNFGQNEERDGDNTEGSYYVLLPDGRTQRVTYSVNGDSGFLAQVEYEEGRAQAAAPSRPSYGAYQ